jgi:hypothetical protein
LIKAFQSKREARLMVDKSMETDLRIYSRHEIQGWLYILKEHGINGPI